MPSISISGEASIKKKLEAETWQKTLKRHRGHLYSDRKAKLPWL